MAEIDEAAAVEWANEVLTRRVPFTIALDYNLARAALAWKARSDALANKWDALIRPESILPLQAAKDWRERAEDLKDTLGLAQLAAQTWKHRAEAAEAEVKRLENVIAADYQLRKEMREYRGTYGYMEGRDILTRREAQSVRAR